MVYLKAVGLSWSPGFSRSARRPAKAGTPTHQSWVDGLLPSQADPHELTRDSSACRLNLSAALLPVALSVWRHFRMPPGLPCPGPLTRRGFLKIGALSLGAVGA